MDWSSLFFFSGGEVSEKVTISRKFKEGVVQPILKVNIPLAINCSKPGKHFLFIYLFIYNNFICLNNKIIIIII